MAQVVEVSTFLPLPPATVWHHVQRPAVLAEVSAPLLKFAPRGQPFPDIWTDGEYQMGVKLFGLVPLDDQIVGIEHQPPLPQGQGWRLRDNGRACARDGGPGGLVSRWDHMMVVAPEGSGTRYTDRVEVEAGLLTPLVAWFARRLYSHRQARWRRLVAEDVITNPATPPA